MPVKMREASDLYAVMVSAGEEPSNLPTRPDPDESKVPPGRVGRSRRVTVPVRRVLAPRPGNDRLLGVTGEQVAPPLPVAVPQLLAQGEPAYRTPDDPAHQGVP